MNMSALNPFPVIAISFAPAWWYHYYGMSFGRDYWQNPIVRTERDREQRRLLYERYFLRKLKKGSYL